MAYVTVSRWSYDSALDETALVKSAEENLSQLKAMGASGGHLVRVSETEGLIVVIYPDEGSWNRVRESVQHMRKDTVASQGGTFVGAFEGPAVVSV